MPQTETPLKVLIVGCGDLGCALGTQLARQGHSVFGARRNPAALPDGITGIAVDVGTPRTLVKLADLEPDILVYCIAASEGTDEGYRQAYVEGLRHVLDCLRAAPALKHVFFVSSTGVYGEDDAQLQDEDAPPAPVDFRGHRLLEAEALLQGLTVPATALRLSGIYGPGRGRMLRLAQAPQQWPERNSWTNRIHRDDAAAFIVHLIGMAQSGKDLAGCYVVSDSRPAPMHEVLGWLHQRTGAGVAPAPKAPGGGKRLDNRNMLATGFTLQYPDYRSGYAALLQGN